MQGWLAAFSAQPLSFCLYIFATAVLVSCKVIALFLRDGQALKDCAEFHCRSWRLGSLPERLPNFIFQPLQLQSLHQAQYSQATTMAARCRQTGRRRHTGSRPVSVLINPKTFRSMNSPLEIEFHSRSGSGFPFAANRQRKPPALPLIDPCKP